MRILSLETSVRVGTLATLAEGSEIVLVHSKELPSSQRTAQSLLPTLQEALRESGWEPRTLELICVATGPGSFTGLRLGATVAKTLAYATKSQLVGVSTLATIAAGVGSENRRLWSILDAQRQELFAACFEAGWQLRPNDLPVPQILSIEDWLGELRDGDLVAGPPLAKLAGRLPVGVEAVDPQSWSPQATCVGRLGFAAYQLGQAVDPMQLVPNYYRKSAAEEKAEGGE